jgi:hypothetical protein
MCRINLFQSVCRYGTMCRINHNPFSLTQFNELVLLSWHI